MPPISSFLEVEKKVMLVGKLYKELTNTPFSMTTYLSPAFCASMAQVIPMGPAPTMSKSYIKKWLIFDL